MFDITQSKKQSRFVLTETENAYLKIIYQNVRYTGNLIDHINKTTVYGIDLNIDVRLYLYLFSGNQKEVINGDYSLEFKDNPSKAREFKLLRTGLERSYQYGSGLYRDLRQTVEQDLQKYLIKDDIMELYLTLLSEKVVKEQQELQAKLISISDKLKDISDRRSLLTFSSIHNTDISNFTLKDNLIDTSGSFPTQSIELDIEE